MKPPEFWVSLSAELTFPGRVLYAYSYLLVDFVAGCSGFLPIQRRTEVFEAALSKTHSLC